MGISQIKPGVFFDRDGVLVANVYYPQWNEWEAPMNTEDVTLLPGTIDALRLLHQARIPLFLVSNQGAYAKGKSSLENLIAVGMLFEKHCAKEDIRFTETFYSYSHPDGVVPDFSGVSLERKPSPYFLRLAAAKYGLSLSDSWMVGDRDTDILCGQRAGVKTILISQTDEKIPTVNPDYTVSTVTKAVFYILEHIRMVTTLSMHCDYGVF